MRHKRQWSSQKRYRPLQASDRAAFQHHRRAPVKSDRARVFVDGHSDYVAESADWLAEAENQRDGQPLSLHLPLHLARKVSKPRRLPARWELIPSAPMCAEDKRQSPKDRPARLSDSAGAVARLCSLSGSSTSMALIFPRQTSSRSDLAAEGARSSCTPMSMLLNERNFGLQVGAATMLRLVRRKRGSILCSRPG
jgi:hypothetical protein